MIHVEVIELADVEMDVRVVLDGLLRCHDYVVLAGVLVTAELLLLNIVLTGFLDARIPVGDACFSAQVLYNLRVLEQREDLAGRSALILLHSGRI